MGLNKCLSNVGIWTSLQWFWTCGILHFHLALCASLWAVLSSNENYCVFAELRFSSFLLKNFSRDWEDGSVSENTSTVQTEGFSSDLIPTCRAGQDCSQLGTGDSIARERNVCVTVTAITLMLSIPEKRPVHRANPPLYTDLEAVSRSYWQNVSTSCFGIVE